MKKNRKVRRTFQSQPTLEGAGVNLKRAFGFYEVPEFDPFLLFDDFRSNNPEDYVKGFPWHPHRGIETITYILRGKVAHGDSMHNSGVIGPGDVQWMTAGSGIIHQEMPEGDENGHMWGFQIWANLPSTYKMMPPRYRDVKNTQIPEITLENNIKIRIVSGEINGVKGPVQDIVVDPEYLDVTVPVETEFIHPTKPGHTVFAYVIAGSASFTEEKNSLLTNTSLVLFEDGNQVTISTKDEPVRFLLLSGKPIREPVAWYGPIVMNTQQELRLAFEEYNNGTFIK
jgi:redox-sensitive bicupin YhaK (pirin superfamily)